MARRADAVRNRRRVVEVAHRVFRQQGPEVTMREVAKEAGVGLGTIYRHFPDKESLLAAVVEDRFRGLTAETREAMSTSTPWEAFTTMMWRMAEMMTEDRAFTSAVAAARMPPPEQPGHEDDEPSATDRLVEARAELDTVLAELAASAKDVGELRDDVGPAELGLLLAGVGFSLGPPDVPARETTPASPPPWSRYLSVVLDGLRATSRGAAGR